MRTDAHKTKAKIKCSKSQAKGRIWHKWSGKDMKVNLSFVHAIVEEGFEQIIIGDTWSLKKNNKIIMIDIPKKSCCKCCMRG